MYQRNKYKILQIIPNEEYFSPINGGAITTWVKECFSNYNDFSITICTPTSPDYYKDYNLIKLPVSVFIKFGQLINGKLGHHLKYNSYPLLAGLIAKIKNYNIIHIHNRPTYIPLIKRLNKNAKIILHMHNDHILSLNSKQLKQLNNNVDMIISVSSYIQNGIIKIMKRNNIDIASKCKILYNGADHEKFTPINNINNNNHILFVGRLIPEKGIKQLMEACIIASEKITDLKLKIVGSAGYGKLNDTPFISSLKTLATRKQNIFEFMGYIPHDKIPELFNQSSLYVIPSVWNEPFGIVVLEGMATKTPMIVSNKGGIPEIAKDTIIMADCNNVEELSNKIIYALSHKKEMKNLAEKAYDRFINNFSWKHIQNNYKKIIIDLYKTSF